MLNCIEKRISIRKYLQKDIDDKIIQELIESARIAPSGSNTQPWHFIIVKDGNKKKEIAEVSHNQNWMLTAPVFIVCVADLSVRIKKEKIEIDENSSLEEVKQIIRDTAIAVEHIVLEAAERGLGTCWVSWFRQENIRPVLNIPKDKYVVCVLTLGYPDEKPARRPRKNKEQFTHYELW